MAESTSQRVLISESDLMHCSAMIEARFHDPAHEAGRVEITRRLLAAAFSLEHTLRRQSRCALVNHCGTHGTSNLADASTSMFEALVTYARLVRETAAQYRFNNDSRVSESRIVLEVA